MNNKKNKVKFINEIRASDLIYFFFLYSLAGLLPVIVFLLLPKNIFTLIFILLYLIYYTIKVYSLGNKIKSIIIGDKKQEEKNKITKEN